MRTITIWKTEDKGIKKVWDSNGWHATFYKTSDDDIRAFYRRKFNLSRVRTEVER